MSHVVTVMTKVRDAAAVATACHRLNLPAPVMGTVQLYSGEASGLIVQLPEWHYPVAIDLESGTARYDNYLGAWGDQTHFDRFLQMYAVEKAKLEARKQGYQVTEQALQDGSIKVQIITGA